MKLWEHVVESLRERVSHSQYSLVFLRNEKLHSEEGTENEGVQYIIKKKLSLL